MGGAADGRRTRPVGPFQTSYHDAPSRLRYVRPSVRPSLAPALGPSAAIAAVAARRTVTARVMAATPVSRVRPVLAFSCIAPLLSQAVSPRAEDKSERQGAAM